MAGAVLSVGLAAPCRAQTVDYGGLQALFGEPVTTSATGSPQKATDSPVNMEIISADDIRRSGADNIPDVLRMAAGIDLRRYGASDADVGIRGYNTANSPRVLVLVNGRQIYVDYYTYTAWATLPVQLDEIRQIEVIKGPNSALYGFNAVGGVVNIVTYDPIFDTVDQATVRGGSGADRQVSAVTTLHLGDRAGLRLSAGGHGQHEFNTESQPTTLGPYPGGNFNRSLYAQGRAVTTNGVDLSAEVDKGDARQFEMTIGGWPASTRYDYNREKLGVGGETGLGYLNLSAYRNWIGYKYLAGYNCASCTGIDNRLWVVQASDLMKPAADHAVRVELEYRNNRASGTIFGNARLGFDLLAASTMWNWQATPTVALTNSVRVDRMSTVFKGDVDQQLRYSADQFDGRVYTEPSFNSAAVWRPTGVDSARLSVSRGVKIPSYYELFPQPVDFGFQNPSFQGNPTLHPTVVMNYEADYDRVLPELESKAGVALFHQTSSDVLALAGDGGSGATDALGGGNQVSYSANIGRSTADGVELTFKGSNSDGWRWRGSYAAILIRDQMGVNPDYNNPNSSVDFRHGAPTHVVGLGLGRSWGAFEADAAARWQSSYDDIRMVGSSPTPLTRFHVENYVTTSARLAYTPIDPLTLAVSGEQLNAGSRSTTSGPPTERRVLGTMTVRY